MFEQVVPPRMSRIERLMNDLEAGPSSPNGYQAPFDNNADCDERNVRVFRDARQLILDLLNMSEKPVGEAIYTAACRQIEDAADDEAGDLATMIVFAKRWLPDCYPASDQGQVHFARALCESLISAAEAHMRRSGQPVEA